MSIKFPLWVGISSLMRISTHQHHPNPPLQFDVNSLRPRSHQPNGPARPITAVHQLRPVVSCASGHPHPTPPPPHLRRCAYPLSGSQLPRRCRATSSFSPSLDRSIHPSIPQRSQLGDATIRSLIGIIFLFSMLFLGFFLFLSSCGGMKAKLWALHAFVLLSLRAGFGDLTAMSGRDPNSASDNSFCSNLTRGFAGCGELVWLCLPWC